MVLGRRQLTVGAALGALGAACEMDGPFVGGSGASPAPARSQGDRDRRMLLFAGPLNEPVARRGPFAMNTDEELRQAFDDDRSGRLTGG